MLRDPDTARQGQLLAPKALLLHRNLSQPALLPTICSGRLLFVLIVKTHRCKPSEQLLQGKGGCLRLSLGGCIGIYQPQPCFCPSAEACFAATGVSTETKYLLAAERHWL